MANTSNLKPFNKGYDSRRGAKPKGSKHLSTWIQELMTDDGFEATILDAKNGFTNYKGAPIKAVIQVAIIKAVDNDAKAREWLAKYGYGHEILKTETEYIRSLRSMSEGELDRLLQRIADQQGDTLNT
jgi:hypothetical protein